MHLMIKPQIFISYSRKDRALADKLVDQLTKASFKVFLDTAEIDPGDNFVAVLEKKIFESDGIIPLITGNYSSSDWAQAELYYATAHKKLIAPLLIDGITLNALQEPLCRFLRDIQLFSARSSSIINNQIDGIEGFTAKLAISRRKRVKRLVNAVLPTFTVLIGIIITATIFLLNLNSQQQKKVVEAAYSELSNGERTLDKIRIAEIAKVLTPYAETPNKLLSLFNDNKLSDNARLNAGQVYSVISPMREKRWTLKDSNFSNVRLNALNFNNLTVNHGLWQNIEIDKSIFSNTYLGNALSFSLLNSKISNSEFIGGKLEAKVTDVVFENVKFHGFELDITSFAGAKFLSSKSRIEKNGTNVINNTVTFNHSVIRSELSAPSKGVIDFSTADHYSSFEGVIFANTEFIGWFDPQWFKDSTFINCKFLNLSFAQQLIKAGNNVDN